MNAYIEDIQTILPIMGKSNMIVRYVQKVCECKEE